MKKVLLLSFMALGMASCSNEETEATPVAAAKQETIVPITKAKPQAAKILADYSKNKATLTHSEATGIFAADCKEYLSQNGHNTAGLDDAQIINLFMKNF